MGGRENEVGKLVILIKIFSVVEGASVKIYFGQYWLNCNWDNLDTVEAAGIFVHNFRKCKSVVKGSGVI